MPYAARANPGAKIRVQSTLVLIPVTVVDPQYHFVAGLKRKDFRLFEDQVEQNIVQCSIEDAPVSVELIVDRSGSMEGKLDQARLAVTEILKTADRKDEFFIVFFNHQLELASNFSTATEGIQRQLFSAGGEGTAVLDAVYFASQRIRRGNAPRRALVLISDGGENNSRYTEFEVRDLLRCGIQTGLRRGPEGDPLLRAARRTGVFISEPRMQCRTLE
jgi:Ca-activated chloride channel homolog